METRLFYPGKYMMLLVLALICVLPTNGEYKCNYLEVIPSRAGWFSIEEMTCQYGCCGDLWEQKCCTKPEDDNRHWVAVVSVIGGLLGVAVVVIVLLCCLKKKNLERTKIYTGNPPPRPRNKGTTSYYDIATEEEGTPPPPYSPRNYAVFITDSSARPSCVTPGRSAAGQLAAIQTRPTLHEQTNAHLMGRQPVQRGIEEPVTHLPPGRPPVYTCLEQGHKT